MYKSINDLRSDRAKVIEDNKISDLSYFKNEVIDKLVYTSVFGDDDLKKEARKAVRDTADLIGVKSSSIHNVYLAIGDGKITRDFSVPAINVRMMTYDTARIIFRLIIKNNIGPVIFEIARSEIDYTDQKPDEYAVCILAAAVKEGYKGPVFIQGDHYQFSKNRFTENSETEINKIKTLIKASLEASFQNIDIDASTLVDLSKSNLFEQQKTNYEITAELTKYIRSIQGDAHVSIGAEIGHIGGKNSTADDLSAFMEGYRKVIPDRKDGISKISVQTGSSHGGIVLPDGTIKNIEIDFNVIQTTGETANGKYKLGGVVQHGASTLPDELFHKFPENKTLEVHLATGFQNIVFDNLPSDLSDEMSQWTLDNCENEREDGWNDKQFVYKLRKKAIGPYKEQCWMLSESQKKPIISALEKQLSFIFEQLNVVNKKDVVLKNL